jgi:tripartite-type tricarboxylate transporter receptor subunit TctC
MHLFARSLRASATVFALSILCAAPAGAQHWPSRPITLIAAFPPNTTTNYGARVIAQDLSTALGEPVVVETRAGGGGVVASVAVAKAPPDGHTLLMTTIGPAVLRPIIDQKLAYDAVRDFTPIVLVGDAPNVIAASAKSGFTSIRDVVAYAKKNPGKLTIGHPGVGTMGHLVALLFAAEAEIEVNFISYQGAPAILSDLAGGHIDVGAIAYGVGADTAKILAVTTEERLDFLPDVPTMKESRYPNVFGTTWSAIFAPAGLPDEIVAKLNTGINDFILKDEIRQQFAKVGYRILGGTPQRLRERMNDDHAKWAKVIAAAKITGDQ